MIKYTWIVLLALLVQSCAPSPEADPDPETSDAPKFDTMSPPEAAPVSVLDTLTLDWYAVKQELRLLNCGEYLPRVKQYLPVLNKPQFYYDYCAHNMAQLPEYRVEKLPKDARLMEAIVVKLDGKIGQFNDQNEALTVLSACIPMGTLGTLNAVRKRKSEVQALWGTPTADTSNCLVYMGYRRAVFFYCNTNQRIQQVLYFTELQGDVEWRTLFKSVNSGLSYR